MTLAGHATLPIAAFLDGAPRVEGGMPLRWLGRISIFKSPVHIRAPLVGSVRHIGAAIAAAGHPETVTRRDRGGQV